MSIRTRNIHFTNWAKVIEALADKGVTVADESAARTFLIETSSDANPYYYYVGYIKDTQEIYTHGKFYNCAGYDDSELRDLIQNIEDSFAEQITSLQNEVEENEKVTAASLSELRENKADKTDLDNYLSKSGGTVNGSIAADTFVGNLTGKSDKASALYIKTDTITSITPGTLTYHIVPASNAGSLPYGENANSVITANTISGNNKYSHQLGFTSLGLFHRKFVGKDIDDTTQWRQIAYVSSNVSSATKLANAVKLWGQDFDGTNDVSGGLTGVSSIYFSKPEGGSYQRFRLVPYTDGNLLFQVASYDGTSKSGKLQIAGYESNNLESLTILSSDTTHNGPFKVDSRTTTNGLSTSNSIILTGTEADTSTISFSRATYNYITSPEGSDIGIHPGGLTKSSNYGYRFTSTELKPGASNTYDLGTSTIVWKNVYATTFTGSLDGNANSASKLYNTTLTFTPPETALTPDEVKVLVDGTTMRRGSWVYSRNGYISSDTTGFGAIDLAGTSVIQVLETSGNYTQLYLTASTTSNTDGASTNEIYMYCYNGDNYSPSWTRVLTNRNYSSYALPKTGGTLTGELSGTSAVMSGLIHTGSYLRMLGKSVTSDVADSFRTSIFETTNEDYARFKIFRTGSSNLDVLPGNYAASIAWSCGDTHAYISMPHGRSGGFDATIGAGNKDKILWSAKLLHSLNYSSFCLPLTGGALTGAVTSTSTFSGTDFITTSDNRLKDFVYDVDVDFENLKQIPKKYYYWKDKSMGEDLQIGTSAQELAKIYPECVHYDETNDRYSVNYQKLSIVALAAIDKLHDRISELESKLYD